MSLHDRARTLTELAAQLSRERSDRPAAVTVITSALDLIPDADWASVTVRVGRSFETLAATHDEARGLDELQYRLREGPCVDTAVTGEWVRSGAVADDDRWPRWGPEAAALGVCSMLSVQLMADGEPVGALNLYSLRPSRFDDPDEVGFALLYASHAALALTSAREIHGLRNAVASRHVIGLAQGVLMERFQLSVEASFALLRRYSNERNVKLVEVARELVGTTPPPADTGSPTYPADQQL